MGLGREWKHPPLKGNSMHASGSILRQIGVKPNNNELVGLNFDLLSIGYTLSGSNLPEKEYYESLFKGSDLSNFNLSDFLTFLPPGFDTNLIDQFLGLQNLSFTFTDENYDKVKKALTFNFNFTVEDEIVEPKGKYPFALGSAMIIEASYVNQLIKESLQNSKKNFDDFIKETLDSMNLDPVTEATIRVSIDDFLESNELYQRFVDFSDTFVLENYALLAVAMYRDRFTAFIKDSQQVKEDISTWTNQIRETLGLEYPVDMNAPLVDAVRVLYYLRLFLDQLLLITEAVLIGISIYLIYSLLISDVEGKVYECGMLRALGMEQYTLIELLVIQSLMFSTAGILIGLVLGWLAMYPVVYFISMYTVIPIEWALSTKAILLSCFLGLSMPCVALIGPTKRALSHSLRDALDVYHNTQNDTIVTFKKLEDIGLSPTQVVLAVFSVLFGFVVYYMIPYSFIFLDLALFFDIFSGIILGMLIGLAFLAMTILPFIENIVVNIIVWGKDRISLKSLVKKNLVGHARRNIKTGVLFTFCIAFIIFTGSIFTLQGGNIVAQAKIGVGSDISVQSFNIEQAIDYSSIKELLDRRMSEKGSPILGYTISTFPLDSHPYIRRTYIATLADFSRSRVITIGVEKNYMSEIFDEYTSISEYDSSFNYEYTPRGSLDVVKSLYDEKGAKNTFLPVNVFSNSNEEIVRNETRYMYENPIPVLMSEAVRLPSSLDTNTPTELYADVFVSQEGRWTKREGFYFLLKPRAMVSKLAGFLFSSYSQTATFSPVVMTLDNYLHILQYLYNRSTGPTLSKYPEDVPVRGLYIRLREDSTTLEREDIINGIKNFVRSNSIIITDVAVIVSSTDTAILVLDIFFIVISIAVLVLCFFVLMISFTTNVTENAWEFGVLRAIGLNSWQVIRVYVYEALTIVLSSVLLGFSIGTVISVTLTLQSNLFTELPFSFEFPWYLFIGIVVMALVVSIFGSYIPASELKKKRIANALKNM
eukprot:TRINITY_DN1270_c0_g1_i1.p1 TRINITY_DN1270_c0_g1~~TRINITY_DN1270_c0_g1_i1.p1  ORF type:complete len:1128 (-),score=212.94 TRINITY_DN1270_c0_g1_i1:60-3026(-)